MLSFGTGKHQLSTVELHEGNCMRCGTPSITLTIYQKYFRFVFIPVFPLRKLAEGKCRNCGREYEQDDLPTYLDEPIAAAKKAERTPPLLFLGLVLFLMAGAYMNYRDNGRAKDAAAYMARPRPHDLYVLPLGIRTTYKYVVCRLEAATADSLTFSVGRDAYAFESGAETAMRKQSADNDDYFTGDLALSKKEVAEMLKGEEIMPIVRPGD